MKRAWAAVAVGIAILVALWLRAGSDEQRSTRARAVAVASGSGSGSTRVAPTRIAGRITRASDGAALPGAIVTIGAVVREHREDDAPRIVTTDRDGLWSATIAAGKSFVTASADGFVPAGADANTDAPVELSLVAGGLPVSGIATDIGGGAVPDAIIAFTDGKRVVAAATRADGRYRVTLDRGRYDLTATHEAYATEHASTSVFDAPVTKNLKLLPAGTIRGLVVARDTGLPVPDAVVDAYGGIPDRIALGDTRTDGAGSFTLHHLPPGAIELTTSARGYTSYAPTTVGLAMGEQVEGIRVVIDRGYGIAGRLVQDGHPVPDVDVYAVPVRGQERRRATAPTDRDGRFEIAGLLPDRYSLIADDATREIADIGVDLIDRDATGLVAELKPRVKRVALTVSGRVEPPGVATVELLASGELTTSDAAGAFELRFYSAGQNTLRGTRDDGSVGIVPLKLADRPLTGITIATSPGRIISGTVVDAEGHPSAGATVSAIHLERDRAYELRTATADRTGAFRISGLTAGEIKLHAYDDGPDANGSKSVHVMLPAGEDRTGITLVVASRGEQIRGVVVDARGAPVADAWVSTRLEQGAGSFTSPIPTQPDGSFAIANLRAGSYDVTALGPRGEARGVGTVRTGETTTIALSPLGAIAGRVVSGDHPVTTYDVGCGDELTQSVHHVDAADGGFRFDHLEPREYTCTARSPTGTTAGKVTVGSGTATLELRITPGGALTGTAVDVLTGAPLAGLAVTVMRSRAFPEAPVVTDATGRFTMERVPASGSLTFAIAGRYAFSGAVRFIAPEGQRVDLGVIRLPAPRTGEPGELGFNVDYRGQPGVVSRVDPAGPAATAGLRVGDQLVSYAGVSLAGLDASFVWRLLWSASAGQTIQLGLARGVTIAVTAVEQ